MWLPENFDEFMSRLLGSREHRYHPDLQTKIALGFLFIFIVGVVIYEFIVL